MKNQKNKFRYSFVVLAFGGTILGMISPIGFSRSVRAQENGVAATRRSIDAPSVKQVGEQLAKQSMEFEENRGQLDKRVRYQARGAGYSLFLTADEAVYVLPMTNQTDEAAVKSVKSRSSVKDIKPKNEATTPIEMFALRMKMVGANLESSYRGEDVREHRTNYFKGNDPENWQTDVPNFSRVLMQEVYPGVSMVWHGKDQGATQYDFEVEPNGNADRIAMEFDGADSIEVDGEGNLLVHTEAGTIKQAKPYSYQEADGIKREVESRFVIERSKNSDRAPQVRFSLGEYDHSKALTIDPYSTFLGGNLVDVGYSIAVDSTGSVYVAGVTSSTSFPTTAGVFDTTQNGGDDICVTKLNAAGTALIYSTFIGGSGSGSGSDVTYAMAVDSAGNAFLTGLTESANYPTTAGAFDTTHSAFRDAFVTKLNAAGSGLIYSTFFGGGSSFNGVNAGQAIAVDSSGNAFVTGYTSGADFPTTVGAFDTSINGGLDDAFVTKINAAGTALIYSTFLGGAFPDEGFGVAVDSSGNAFVTGHTQSAGFPTTAGAFDTTQNGFYDVFVTKVNPAGSALIYSTFIGGSGDSLARTVAIDSSGNAFLAGYTGAVNFPSTPGAFDSIHSGTNSTDAFITKLNAAGSALVYSTFLSGTSQGFNADADGIIIDSSGNAFVTGTTDSASFPTTPGAFDTSFNGGGSDVFLTKLNAAGSALIYSTFIGGASADYVYGIAVDPSGNAFVTGQTNSNTYPITAGAFDTSYNGNGDTFVTSLSTGPTAASVSVSGRVLTAGGRGLRNACVSLTDDSGLTFSVLTGPLGYYHFEEITSGKTYVIAVRSRRIQFASRVLQVNDNLSDVDLIAEF